MKKCWSAALAHFDVLEAMIDHWFGSRINDAQQSKRAYALLRSQVLLPVFLGGVPLADTEVLPMLGAQAQ
ncbi:MAG: hypothetical protein AAF404_14015 [Pseudomonadota bacterium]